MRALTLLLLLALPIAAQTPDQGGAVAVLRGVEFPEVNGQFTIARMTRYPMESAGASASYLSEGIRGEISVYVYPGEGPVTPETLEELFQLDIKATVEYARRAREATVESRPDSSVSVVGENGVRYDGFRGEFTMRRGNDQQTSLLHVFIKDGQFIKFRSTYDDSDTARMLPELDRFIARSLGRIKVPG
jgi:hypothetical protein